MEQIVISGAILPETNGEPAESLNDWSRCGEMAIRDSGGGTAKSLSQETDNIALHVDMASQVDDSGEEFAAELEAAGAGVLGAGVAEPLSELTPPSVSPVPPEPSAPSEKRFGRLFSSLGNRP